MNIDTFGDFYPPQGFVNSMKIMRWCSWWDSGDAEKEKLFIQQMQEIGAIPKSGTLSCSRCYHRVRAEMERIGVKRWCWKCTCCKKHYSITQGTIFYNSKIGMDNALLFLYYFCQKCSSNFINNDFGRLHLGLLSGNIFNF